MQTQERPDFDGAVYERAKDLDRLTLQHERVRDVLLDGKWRTLPEMRAEIQRRYGRNDPEASISAQLRHLRKERFGAYTIEKRARGHRENGLFEYRIVV